MGFLKISNNNLVFFQIQEFNDTNLIKHGFSTKKSGYSSGEFKALNLGLYTDDDKNKVIKNIDAFKTALGINSDSVYSCKQVHGKRVVIVDENSRPEEIIEADGLVTNCPNKALIMFFADCVPLLFLDPVKRAIAIAHSGWQGTAKKISQETINLLEAQYGSNREDLLVAIGPSIGPCHYEVDSRVIKHFEKDFPKEIIRYKGDSKADLDLWKANEFLLEEAGVLPENIFNSNLCSYCHSDLFFSYRRDLGKTGRLGAMIMLK